ncbi:hypothetical protein Tco_0409469 [Tanacetum coccineum]
MVAYLEKSEGNTAFHEIVDFLTASSVHHALTVSPTIDASYIEQFGNTAYSQTVSMMVKANSATALILRDIQIQTMLVVTWTEKSPRVPVKYLVENWCCASILWMKSQLSDYEIHYKKVPIFCDNTSAIAISNNPVLHSRTKHIDIRFHFFRDHILKGDIELHFIPTEYQLADIFTKSLDEPTFTRLKAELGMLNIN